MWQPVMGVTLGPGGKSVPGRERERPRGVREQARKKVSVRQVWRSPSRLGGTQRGAGRAGLRAVCVLKHRNAPWQELWGMQGFLSSLSSLSHLRKTNYTHLEK